MTIDSFCGLLFKLATQRKSLNVTQAKTHVHHYISFPQARALGKFEFIIQRTNIIEKYNR